MKYKSEEVTPTTVQHYLTFDSEVTKVSSFACQLAVTLLFKTFSLSRWHHHESFFTVFEIIFTVN